MLSKTRPFVNIDYLLLTLCVLITMASIPLGLRWALLPTAAMFGWFQIGSL